MWECSYANEPVDVKLLWLFFLRKIWIWIAAVLAGALLIGGGYFVKNVVLASEKEYQTVGEVYVDYVWEDAYGISRSNLNEEEWKALVKTDVFVDDMLEQLTVQGISLEKQFVRESVDAALISDSRIVTTTVITDTPELSAAIGCALQEALIHFGEDNSRIERIRVLTTPVETRIVVHDIRTLQASILGAVLGGLLSLAAMFLCFVLDDSIYIPAAFERRYHIPMLGTAASRDLAVNLRYLLRDCGSAAVTAVEQDIPVEKVTRILQEKLEATGGRGENKIMLCACGCVDTEPEAAEELRRADGVILVAASGRHDGKRIEKTLAFLGKQDIKVSCALLWNADEKLIKRYYGFGILPKKRSADSPKSVSGKLEVLAAAVNKKPELLAQDMNLQTDAVIVNQCDREASEAFSYRDRTIRVFSRKERGVGLSRNMALSHAEGSIVLFSDEDIRFYDGYEKQVLSAFQDNPAADVITFNFKVDERRATYYNKEVRPIRWHNYGRYPTYSVAAKLDSLREKGIAFSLLFGGGAKYSNGEDSLFLHDCLKKGLHLYTSTEEIGEEVYRESTWFKGYNEKFFTDRGVLYAFLYGRLARLMALRFLLAHKTVMCGEKTPAEAYRLMKKGIKLGRQEQAAEKRRHRENESRG